jgi:hypothetical protein
MFLKNQVPPVCCFFGANHLVDAMTEGTKGTGFQDSAGNSTPDRRANASNGTEHAAVAHGDLEPCR